VANDLGLTCHPGEPLRLDGVFTSADAPRWEWFPCIVAVEHENNPSTFGNEVRKLLSVRCPLKVGITYAMSSDTRDPTRLCAGIAAEITKPFGLVNQLLPEDGSTEYLFLVGVEMPVGQRELAWHSLHFRAGDGLRIDQKFEPTA
jgi:hypothetical protein